MPNRLQLRPVSASEETQIRHLAASRSKPARLVQRARVIEAMLDDRSISSKEAGFRAGYRSTPSGQKWIRRFNEGGIEALDDRPRSGRPLAHDEKVRSKLLDLVLQKPRSLGYPFKIWTLDRLQETFFEWEQVRLATSTIWEWVEAQGLKWRCQESWFHEAEIHDERFTEKKGHNRGLRRSSTPDPRDLHR